MKEPNTLLRTRHSSSPQSLSARRRPTCSKPVAIEATAPQLGPWTSRLAA